MVLSLICMLHGPVKVFIQLSRNTLVAHCHFSRIITPFGYTFVTQHIPYKRHKSSQKNYFCCFSFRDSTHASTSDCLYRTKCPSLAYIGPLLFIRYSIIVETAIPRYSLSSLVLNSFSCIVCSFGYTFLRLQTMCESHVRNIMFYQ